MKIASWNVNSIRARLESVLEWVRQEAPDVICLQETKVIDENFPCSEFARLGYELALAGQRSYNGVAIAARAHIADVQIGLTDENPDSDRRFIAGTIAGLRVASVYVPNGKNVESESFRFKLDWLGRLAQTLRLQQPSDALIVCGDFNIAREDRDVHDPDTYRGQLHFHPEEHRALNRVLEGGLVDAFRLFDQAPASYSWWDYRAGAFRRNRGLRIDYILASESLRARCSACHIDRTPRAKPKPSDHAPVVLSLR